MPSGFRTLVARDSPYLDATIKNSWYRPECLYLRE